MNVVLDVPEDNLHKGVVGGAVDRGQVGKQFVQIPHQGGCVVLLRMLSQNALMTWGKSNGELSHHRVVHNLVLDEKVFKMTRVLLGDVFVVVISAKWKGVSS